MDILNDRHYTKEEKETATQFVKTHNCDEFYNYYISNVITKTQEHFDISKNVMRLVRKIYGISENPPREKKKINTHKGFMWCNNGTETRHIYPGQELPDGFVYGQLPRTDEWKKHLSEAKKGVESNTKGKFAYNNGETTIYLSENEVIPDGFVKGSRYKGYKAYNRDGKTAFFSDDDIIPDGWVLGEQKNELKSINSVKSRQNSIEQFEKENDVTLISKLQNLTDYAWYSHKDFTDTLNIVKYVGYRFVANSDIEKIKNYIPSKAVETRIAHIKQFEKDNNCICTERLVEKYGQLSIYNELNCLSAYGAKYIKLEDIEKIEEYIKQLNKPYSNLEKELLNFIKSIYSGEIQENNNKILYNESTGRYREIDIYIPQKKIGIEFNGLYWHSDLFLSDKKYHLNKSLQAENAGIRLIHIYEDEWKYDKEKIKQLISIALGCVDTIIYARNCTVMEISNAEAKEFSNKTHLQGHRNASVTYGLFYNNELVQLMSFSKTKNAKANGAEWEIIRGCPGSNNIVIGGVSKLFKHFVDDYSPESIFSYCDFNKFNGVSYEKLGMKFVGYTGPDKYWLISGRRVPRKSNKYKELKKVAQGIIWGAGSKKYIWYKENLNEDKIN